MERIAQGNQFFKLNLGGGAAQAARGTIYRIALLLSRTENRAN
jgi:hypothetical protein